MPPVKVFRIRCKDGENQPLFVFRVEAATFEGDSYVGRLTSHSPPTFLAGQIWVFEDAVIDWLSVVVIAGIKVRRQCQSFSCSRVATALLDTSGSVRRSFSLPLIYRNNRYK